MATETVSFESLFDEYLKKSSEIVSDYSAVMSAIAGKQLYLVPLLPIENQELEGKKKTISNITQKKEVGEKEKKPVLLTQEEIDDIIIKAVSRTSLDLHSKSFLSNLKKKLPGITRKDVEKRMDELNNQGKLKKKDE